MMNAALEYLKEHSLCVIPMTYDPPAPGEAKGKKRPLIRWKEYQEHLPTEQDVRKWWQQWPDAMVGVVTGAVSGICTIDVDEQIGYEQVENLIPDNLEIPTYTTPSGGCQMVFRMPEDISLQSAVRNLPGCDLRANGGIAVFPPSKNPAGSYSWMFGLSLCEVPPPPLPIAYINKIKIYSNKVPCNNPSLQTLHSLHLLQEGTRDNDLFHLLNCLYKGGYEKEYAFQIAEIIAKNCNPAFDLKDAYAKVESAYARGERKIQNLNQEVRDWVLLQERYIYVTECYEALHLLHANDKTNCRVILHRLCKEGILERISQGTFRRIEQDCADIDIWSADVTPLPIKYPLGLHEFVNTYPKNIIVVAGEPDAGKTAFLLNLARLNMCQHEVVYFSSEMGRIELRTRLEKFNVPMDEWKRVAWKERAADFAPMIRPNAVNIIDFLEIHENFFEVGKLIKQIFDKLENGIAVIALQKPKGRDEGLGGQRGLEKPRLYLSMSPGLLKIVKAKNWRHENINPNGMMRKWRLGGGCHFKTEGDWYC